MMALAVLVLGLSGFAYYQYSEDRKAEAAEERRLAQERQRAATEATLVAAVEEAMGRDDLVSMGQESGSAYSAYLNLERQFPESSHLARLKDRILPELQSRLNGFYDRFARTSEAEDSEWAEVGEMAEWAERMSPQSQRFRAQHFYAQARAAFEQRKFDQAARQFEAAIGAWPDWALPYNSRGRIEAQRRNYEEAARWYREASEVDPDWAFPLENLSGASIKLERWSDAEDALRRAESAGGGSGAAWADLSNEYMKRDMYRQALSAARQALRLGGRGFDGERMNDRIYYLNEYTSGYEQNGWEYQAFIEAMQAAGRGAR